MANTKENIKNDEKYINYINELYDLRSLKKNNETIKEDILVDFEIAVLMKDNNEKTELIIEHANNVIIHFEEVWTSIRSKYAIEQMIELLKIVEDNTKDKHEVFYMDLSEQAEYYYEKLVNANKRNPIEQIHVLEDQIKFFSREWFEERMKQYTDLKKWIPDIDSKISWVLIKLGIEYADYKAWKIDLKEYA